MYTSKNLPNLHEMTKPKKITVKFFLNKNLQPQKLKKEGDRRSVSTYPLYIQVIYNRANTQFKSFYGDYYSDLSKVDDENMSGPGLLKFEEHIIRKIVEYETEKQGEKFDLKTITKKYESYCQSIEGLLNEYLKGKLKRILFKTKPYEYAQIFNYSDSKVESLLIYKAAKSLYDNFEKSIPKDFIEEMRIYEDFTKAYFHTKFSYNFPVVIDWLDGSLRIDIEGKFKTVYKNDKKKVTKSLEILDNIILTKIGA
jgi:hypothetical protein